MSFSEVKMIAQDIPFIDLNKQREKISLKIEAAIQKVLVDANYIMGPEVLLFEQQLSKFTASKNVISCSNGTDALILALMALGIKENDAVFVPAFTFAATAGAVALVGATPIFVDSDIKTYNICIESLKSAITMVETETSLNAKAIIPVDLFGLPANYHKIQAIAQENNLKVIVDAAQSLGATYGNRQTVKYGDIATTSFFPAKPLGCYGDGGAVFTDDDEISDIIKSLRVHGKGTNKYDNVRVGLNARLDTIQAAILIEKLNIFPNEIDARNNIASIYSEALAKHTIVPFVPESSMSVWAQYTIRVENRDVIQQSLKEKGIPSVVYYPLPLSEQTAYKHFPKSPEGTPVSSLLSKSVLSLPMHPYLDTETQNYIINNLLLSLEKY